MVTTSLLLAQKPDTIETSDAEREPLNAVESFETYRNYLVSIAY